MNSAQFRVALRVNPACRRIERLPVLSELDRLVVVLVRPRNPLNIGAAARANGLTYGQLIHGLKAAGIELDRKVLADIAVKDAVGFTALAAKAKAFAPKPAAKKA